KLQVDVKKLKETIGEQERALTSFTKQLDLLKPGSLALQKAVEQLDALEAEQMKSQTEVQTYQAQFEAAALELSRLENIKVAIQPMLDRIENETLSLKKRDEKLKALQHLQSTDTLKEVQFDEASASPFPSRKVKKPLLMALLLSLFGVLALMIGYEMTTPAWKAETLADNLRLPILASSATTGSGPRRKRGVLSPEEARGLSLRLRSYVPDTGGVFLVSSLNEGNGVDRLVNDLSGYFAMRDERVLILDARIAHTRGDSLFRLLERPANAPALEVVPVDEGDAAVDGPSRPGLVQYLVFDGPT